MDQEQVFKYVELILGYMPIWAVILIGFIVYLVRNPNVIKSIPDLVSKAKIGDFEIELREVKTELAQTKAQVVDLKEENKSLRSLFTSFDADASVSDLGAVRQELKDAAGSIDDISIVYSGLAQDADKEEVYASAVILRKRRDIAAFDELVSAIDRIGSHKRLEGLRFLTVWTLASALHKTTISAVRDQPIPKVSEEQLTEASKAIQRLADNPHVQNDRPDDPDKGIRGPCRHALTWIDKGLSQHRST